MLALAGCKSTAEPPGVLLQGFLDLAQEARLFSPDKDPSSAKLPSSGDTLQMLALLEGAARAALRDAPEAHPVEVLNRVVFVQEGFRREVQDPALRFALLPAVLLRRRGNCLGLSSLYLALGERLRLPLHGVLAPGHFFVRYDNGRSRRGVELFKQGKQMPIKWYLRKYKIPVKNPLYLRNLTPRQSLAVLRYNLANEHRRRGNLRTALEHYQQVVALLPDFAEAQANLGLTLHRLGDLGGAEQAYQRARQADPSLPGLKRNLEALQSEHAPSSARATKN